MYTFPLRRFMVHLVTEIDFEDGAPHGLSLRTIKGRGARVSRSQRSKLNSSKASRPLSA